jgi:phosphoribosyl-dephospho-CoA transferase
MPLALFDQAQTAIHSASTATNLVRHQLAWLTDHAWTQIQTQPWDLQAQALLTHWRTHRLPLVVTRQRGDVAPGQVCLGLPAPAQWSRRKLGIDVPLSAIAAQGMCPTLAQIALAVEWCDAADDLASGLAQLGVQARVHGSYAWQHLTGLTYLHADSDLDLHLEVSQLDQASQVTDLLAHTQLPARLDGEVIFPGGQAVAWRELAQLFNGKVSQVLLKNRIDVRLVNLAQLSSFCGTRYP